MGREEGGERWGGELHPEQYYHVSTTTAERHVHCLSGAPI